MENIVVPILTGLLTYFIFWIFNKTIPAEKFNYHSNLSIDELRKKHIKKYILSTFLYFFLMLLCFIFSGYVIVSLTNFVYENTALFSNNLQPSRQSWYILIFFIGFDLCGILSPYFFKLLSGKTLMSLCFTQTPSME